MPKNPKKDTASAEKQRNYAITGTLQLAVFGFLGYQPNKIRKERNDKIAFTEALISTQEAERERIARDLNYGVGQSLLLIKKQLKVTHTIIVENQNRIGNTLEEVKSISRDLHPFQLEKLGLTATLIGQVEKIEKSSHLFISKEIDNIDDQVSNKDTIHIFRTVQEGFNNILKHSGASTAKIIVEDQEKDIIIKIMDNGKGFDHELVVVKSKCMGLKTMNKRIQAIGGTFKISANSPSGTQIVIDIPKLEK